MAKCKWCGAEIIGSEALCDKCKAVAKPKKTRPKSIRCCKCGKEEKRMDNIAEPYKCAECIKHDKGDKIVLAVILILAAIPIIWFLFILANVDSDTKGTCYVCRDKAEYQWGDYEYCEKHYYQALGKSILD